MTYDHFRDEVKMFRRAMCNKQNSICATDKAYGNLFFCVNQVMGSDAQRATDLWESTSLEWMRRKELMLAHGHPVGEPTDRTIFEEAA